MCKVLPPFSVWCLQEETLIGNIAFSLIFSLCSKEYMLQFSPIEMTHSSIGW